ncbi:MAG: nitrilase [Candidatus Binatia bacterium]|nr:MAG: nitrilase [Candidatus Binatia bacterium]
MAEYFVAAVQACSGPDKEANLTKAASRIEAASRRGCRLVVLPELFSWRPRDETDTSGAETVPGPTSELCSSWAKKYDVFLVAGSILERAEGGKAYNTALCFDPSGRLLARYRKIHLFDVDLPGGVQFRESSSRLAGTELTVVPTEIGVLGLAICYDLRFPELFRAMVRRGTQVFCIPSAFTHVTGAAHWEVLLRARAVENQAYVVAPNQVGTTPRGSRDFGNTMVVDPWGVPVARVGETEDLAIAKVDLAYLERIRRDFPCLEHTKFPS